jgi:hypothetical protein
MIPNFSDLTKMVYFNEKRSPADVRLKAALTDE